MAEVYRRVAGRKLEKYLAVEDGVQDSLTDTTLGIAFRAGAILAEHHHDGHAQIEVEEGKVDHYVVLSDDRGQKAAMSIEYGREPDPETGAGGMEGLMILHRAAHLRKRG